MSKPTFTYIRPQHGSDVPPPDPRYVDVHILDMNHSWQNAGHDSMVGLVRRLAADFAPSLAAANASVRLISYDVRQQFLIPADPPAGEPSLYLSTGGPGDLDPKLNRKDDVDNGEIEESDAWEEPLFAFFEAAERNDRAMLYAVCHSYGLLCRWSGAAKPVHRRETKGSMSIGIVDNILTPQALKHPWFSRLAQHLPDGKHVPVVDSRHYDLIPERKAFPRGITPIGYECLERGGPAGEAVTMIEFARKANGTPRMFGANHHPEIPDATELTALLRRKLDDGAVSQEWYDSRARLLTQLTADDHSEPARLLGAGYTFTFLVRDGLKELIEARKAQRHGRSVSQAL